MITLSVFLWAVITANLCILILHCLIRNTRLLLRCGLVFFLICCFLCTMRLFLPVEFSNFQHKIEYPNTISSLMKIFISDGNLSALAYGLAAFCISFGFLLAFLSLFDRNRIKKRLYEFSTEDKHSAQILAAIDPNCEISTRRSLLIRTPIIAGCRNPVIYLPQAEYSDTDLYGILNHEYTHWQNKHLWIKSLVHLLALLLWWNPFIFLLEKDFSHLLEIQCDDLSTRHLGSSGKIEYLETLIHCLDSANQVCTDTYSRYGLAFLGVKAHHQTRQRFEYQLERLSEIRTRHWQSLGLYTILFCWILASYYYIAQPAYSPECEIVYSNAHNSYLMEHEDGSYSFYFNEQQIAISSEDVKSGYYSIYPKFTYKESKKKPLYAPFSNYQEFYD